MRQKKLAKTLSYGSVALFFLMASSLSYAAASCLCDQICNKPISFPKARTMDELNAQQKAVIQQQQDCDKCVLNCAASSPRPAAPSKSPLDP